jgi:ABC-2 type transport system ATP-binding protein
VTDDQGTCAVEALGMGKRYRRRWALRDCAFTVPAGAVCGLVGPNGAGKSTLLALAAGLLGPSEGDIRVLGSDPRSAEVRARISFVSQDKPLYPRFTVAETLRLGRELNPGWDEQRALDVVRQGQLPEQTRIGQLSGGQRTRVALALALGKCPDLLLLDEPMADLDPLARHQLMGTLMAQAAEHGTTVVISSHILAELDGVIDHLLLVDGGRTRLAGEVDDILAGHRLLQGSDAMPLEPHTVVEARRIGRQLSALVKPSGPIAEEWTVHEPTLEELLLAYLRSPEAAAPGYTAAAGTEAAA